MVKNIPRMIKNGDGSFILKEARWGWLNFTRGISENLSEHKCWKRIKAPFLAQTYFSLGIVTISKRQYGQPPSPEELALALKKLPEPAQAEIKNLDGHCLEASNFVKTPQGIILVDYDNGTAPTAKKYPFTIFLEKWHRELENVFLPKIVQNKTNQTNPGYNPHRQ